MVPKLLVVTPYQEISDQQLDAVPFVVGQQAGGKNPIRSMLTVGDLLARTTAAVK